MTRIVSRTEEARGSNPLTSTLQTTRSERRRTTIGGALPPARPPALHSSTSYISGWPGNAWMGVLSLKKCSLQPSWS
jgi:hypothetical protein